MNLNRQKVLDQLERTRQYVDDTDLLISEDERSTIHESLDNCVRYARYGRYHVTTLGLFSTGKSTLLNAMLEDRILPSADVPVTAITTEIYFSEKDSIFIPMESVPEDVLQNFSKGLESFPGANKAAVVTTLERDGEQCKGIGAILDSHDSDLILKIISELTSQQSRNKAPFDLLKNLLDTNHDLGIWLSISTMPNWLKDIVLTDVPGTGSTDENHEIVINKIIPNSQLVLYLIESSKPGSAIDKSFSNRISNTYHRKIFYILNKIDQQNSDELSDSLDLVKRGVPEVLQDGDKPEFLCVAGLYALVANEVKKEKMSLNEVLNDVKINLNQLLIDPSFLSSKEDQRINALAAFLHKKSNFDVLKNRIEEYLKYENKEIAIEQQASSLIRSILTVLSRSCNNSVRILESDTTVEELREKKDAAHELRIRYSHEAEIILNDYLNSALDKNTGLEAILNGLLSSIPVEVSQTLSEKLEDPSNYKYLTKKENLQSWLTKELQSRVEGVIRNLNAEINKRYYHLLEQLSPILKKIDDESLANSIDSIAFSHVSDTTATNAPHVVGGAVAGGVLFGGGAWVLTSALGFGASTAAIATPAAGLAGTFAALGFDTLAAWSASAGFGALATTTTTTTTLWGLSAVGFFVPVVGVGAAAAAIVALLIFNKKWKKKQIVEKTEELLKKIVLTGGVIDKKQIVSVSCKMCESINKTVSNSAETIKEKIKTRLKQMNEEEEKIIEEFKSASELKKQKIERISQLNQTLELFDKELQR